jgi:hypothetical protein
MSMRVIRNFPTRVGGGTSVFSTTAPRGPRIRKKENVMRHAFVLVAILLTSCLSGATSAEDTAFDEVFSRYEMMRQALIGDSTDGVADNAAEIASIARELRSDFSPAGAGVDAADAGTLVELLPRIEERADSVAAAGSLEEARERLAELTKPLVRWHELIEGPRPVVAYCPMVKKAWLQPDEAIGNPYAPYMLRCGEVVQR